MSGRGKGWGLGGLTLLLVVLGAPRAAASPGATLSLKPLLGIGDARHQTLLLATACSDDGLADALLRLEYTRRLGLQTHQERIDVPAGGCVQRAVTTTLRSEVRAILQTKEGHTVARTRPELMWWQRAGVVLDASLKGIVNGGVHANFMMIPEGVDIPPDAMAWSSVSYVVTRDRSLADQRPALQRAIEHWVSRGGTLVVASDEVRPEEVRGAGHIVTLRADETLPAALHALRYQRPADSGRFGVDPGLEADRRHYWWGGYDDQDTFAPIDPNGGHPTSSGLSWILLLGYVALVGPLSYRWLARRNRTILAIGTVPTSAALLAVALASHGWLEKGSRPRYAAIALAEVLGGERTAAVRRTAGFVTTDPGWMRIVSSRGAVLSVLPVGQRTPRWRRSTVGGSSDGRRSVLETGPVGLWDPVFVAEGAFADLGGSVEIVRTGAGLRVVNRTPRTIRNAMLREVLPPQYYQREWSLGSLAPGDARQVDPKMGHRGDTRVLPPQLAWGTNGRDTPVGASLLGKLDEPILPPFGGYERDHETTWLQVLMP